MGWEGGAAPKRVRPPKHRNLPSSGSLPAIAVDGLVHRNGRLVARGFRYPRPDHAARRVVPKHCAASAAEGRVARMVAIAFARQRALDPRRVVRSERVARIALEEPLALDIRRMAFFVERRFVEHGANLDFGAELRERRLRGLDSGLLAEPALVHPQRHHERCRGGTDHKKVDEKSKWAHELNWIKQISVRRPSAA